MRYSYHGKRERSIKAVRFVHSCIQLKLIRKRSCQWLEEYRVLKFCALVLEIERSLHIWVTHRLTDKQSFKTTLFTSIQWRILNAAEKSIVAMNPATSLTISRICEKHLSVNLGFYFTCLCHKRPKRAFWKDFQCMFVENQFFM